LDSKPLKLLTYSERSQGQELQNIFTRRKRSDYMSRDVIDQKIFEIIKYHPSTTGMNAQSIRNAISKIHSKNHGITMNAAASVFAQKKDFRVYRYLSSQDKDSLKYLKEEVSSGQSKNAEPTQIISKKKRKTITLLYGQKYQNDANKNAEIYPHIYIIENTLRDLILETFKDKANWWNNAKIVKPDIPKHAEYIKGLEEKHKFIGKRADHPIYYVNLCHLLKIIEMNYNPHFKKVFPNLNNLRTWIDEIEPVRNLVAHNVKTQNEERQNIQIKAKYICNLVENVKG